MRFEWDLVLGSKKFVVPSVTGIVGRIAPLENARGVSSTRADRRRSCRNDEAPISDNIINNSSSKLATTQQPSESSYVAL